MANEDKGRKRRIRYVGKGKVKYGNTTTIQKDRGKVTQGGWGEDGAYSR